MITTIPLRSSIGTTAEGRRLKTAPKAWRTILMTLGLLLLASWPTALGAEVDLKDARTALGEGDYAKSVDLARQATEKHPQSADGFILLAQGQRLLANFRGGRDQGRLATQSVQSLKQAITLLGSEKNEAAKTDLQYCQHLLAAWAAAGDQAWAKAGAEYDSAAKLKPDDEFAAFGARLTARNRKDIGPWTEGVRRLSFSSDPNFAKAANDDRTEIKNQISMIEREAVSGAANLLQNEKVEEAEALLRSAVRRAPPSGLLHFELAKTLTQRGKVEEAMREFREALRNNYTEPERFVDAAKTPPLLNNKEYLAFVSETFGAEPAQRISSDWKKMEATMVQEKHTNFLNLTTEARDLMTNRKYDEALKLAQKGVELYPTEVEGPQLVKEIEEAAKQANCAAMVTQGREMAANHRFAEAESLAKQALALIPENPEAASLLGELPKLKQSHADELLTTTRASYKRQRQQAYENLREIFSLFPEQREAQVLQGEMDTYFAHLDALRKKALSAGEGQADFDTMAAIIELRGLIPEDQEVAALWRKHCIIENSIGMRLIFVTPPPGNSRASARGFFLAEFETTEEQWAKIMPQYQTNMIYGDSSAKTWNLDGTYYHPAQDHPVCQVSLPDALAFVQKLSDQEGKNYRLPTVTEWEHACLAGQPASNSPGAVLDKVAWFHDNAARKGETHP